jgi:hypothetical protein
MTDNYLTATFVDSIIGSDVRVALFTNTSGTYKTIGFLNTCIAATSIIRNAIKSAGYTPPADNAVGDPFIQMAALGEFASIAFNRPDKVLPLPEDWRASPWMLARKAIMSGEAQLDLEVSTSAGHGGIMVSSSADEDYPPIFTRESFNNSGF